MSNNNEYLYTAGNLHNDIISKHTNYQKEYYDKYNEVKNLSIACQNTINVELGRLKNNIVNTKEEKTDQPNKSTTRHANN